MSAGDLAVVLAAVLCCIGFAALIVALLRVHDTLRELRVEVTALRAQTGPLIAELRATADGAREAIDEARDDLERFDRVLGSAEAISGAVGNGGRRIHRVALSTPVIKAAALATGTSRAARRMRRKELSA